METVNNYEDLYNDLPEETTSDYIAKIENQLESVQKRYDDSQTLMKQMTAEKQSKEKRIEELEKVVEDLKRNMSSLYKTAIVEIKRKDNMLNELRVENDDLAFRRRNKLTTCDRDKSREHRNNRERHHKEGTPVEEKYKHRSRCKRLPESKSRYHERQRFDVKREKSSSERNGHRNGEFHSKERHPKFLPKMVDVEERHSISPRDRIENLFGMKNGSVVRNEHRSIQEKYPKSQISSSTKSSPEAPTSLQYAKSEHRSIHEKHSKSHFNSWSVKNGSEAQTSSHFAKNEHQSGQDKHPKSRIISLSMKNDPEVQTSSQNVINVSQSSQKKHPNAQKEKEIPSQKNGYLRCEAALLSMKKQSCKLLTPIKDTPDLLKKKFSQVENMKIKPVIPMINERRMLSPYKNVGIVEIVSEKDNESESFKPTEPKTVTTYSVTVSEDIEHGVFSRKSRKRPRIQKIITDVKKVTTC